MADDPKCEVCGETPARVGELTPGPGGTGPVSALDVHFYCGEHMPAAGE